MTLPTNRVLLLTPPGGAAIAVVRLVGPGAGDFLRAYFDKPVMPGRAVHGNLTDPGAGGRVLDDPVVVASSGGAVIDLCLHGGPWVVRTVLELAGRAGFDAVAPVGVGAVLPPEAVDAEDLWEREMLTHLPLARTEFGLRALLAEPAAWADLRRAATAGELDPRVIGGIWNDQSLWWLLHPPRVAIVGLPNVGKSTLANRLFAQERSITADLPGTTCDWVGEMADVDGLAVMLVDTPGLRETLDPIESSAIDQAAEQVAAADLVVLVLDATRLEDADAAGLIERFPKALGVINKCDQAGGGDLPASVLRTVATRGEGVDSLRCAIAARFGCDALDLDRPRWWTRRQREWLGAIASGTGS